MNDELDARVRALDAERARPARGDAWPRSPAGSVEVLLGELIAALAGMYRTPPDREQGTT